MTLLWSALDGPPLFFQQLVREKKFQVQVPQNVSMCISPLVYVVFVEFGKVYFFENLFFQVFDVFAKLGNLYGVCNCLIANLVKGSIRWLCLEMLTFNVVF